MQSGQRGECPVLPAMRGLSRCAEVPRVRQRARGWRQVLSAVRRSTGMSEILWKELTYGSGRDAVDSCNRPSRCDRGARRHHRHPARAGGQSRRTSHAHPGRGRHNPVRYCVRRSRNVPGGPVPRQLGDCDRHRLHRSGGHPEAERRAGDSGSEVCRGYLDDGRHRRCGRIRQLLGIGSAEYGSDLGCARTARAV